MNRVAALLGVAFGFGLGAARLNDYDVIHDMLLLREPEVFLLMASAMAVALPVLWLLERGAWHTPGGGLMRLSRSNIERKHIFGSAVFGGGWAITGACPGTALAMPAAGVALGLPVIAGVLAGQILRESIAKVRPIAPGRRRA
ncbi:MAG: hypothetical protein E6I18_15435 [Chloroflexi bacterium]|nr:MAG: hypothetical protein E6I18_15435 [Chloroflexota bacterium]